MENVEQTPKRRLSSAALAQALQQNSEVLIIIVGCSLALFPFNWGLSVASGQTMFVRPLDFNALIDIGEVAGFVGGALLAWKSPQLLMRSRLCIGAFALVVVGNGLIALYEGPVQSKLCAVCGDIIMGFGYAFCLLLWLGLVSKLSPRKMLLTVSVGFVFNLFSYPVIADVSVPVGYAYVVVVSALSAALWCAGNSIMQPSSPAEKSSRPKPYIPAKRLILFVSIIPFAYGFCTSYLNIGVSTIGLKLGFALPSIIIILGLFLRYETFNLSTVYWITCPLMIVGLLTSFFLSLPPMLSKLFISAALVSVHLIMYAVVRVQSQEQGRDPIFAYAVLKIPLIILTITGKEIENLIAGTPGEPYIIIILIMVVVLSYGLIVAGSNGKGAFNINTALSGEVDRDHSMRLAQQHGLSKRETSVYALLLDERTIAEIAEELFIAPSTVRAHVSRIYEKFDVHSRQEFLRKTRS